MVLVSIRSAAAYITATGDTARRTPSAAHSPTAGGVSGPTRHRWTGRRQAAVSRVPATRRSKLTSTALLMVH